MKEFLPCLLYLVYNMNLQSWKSVQYSVNHFSKTLKVKIFSNPTSLMGVTGNKDNLVNIALGKRNDTDIY